MADYTEAWKEWDKEQDRKQCTCPICGQYKEGEYCSESCCAECADSSLITLQKLMSVIPDYAREQIVEWLIEDDAYMLHEWANNGPYRTYPEIMPYIIDECTQRQKKDIYEFIGGQS